MVGKHKVIIESKSIVYELEIKRNITIIKGDSGRGKSLLVDLIVRYNREKRNAERGKKTGRSVSITCDKECFGYRQFDNDSRSWSDILREHTDCIIFLAV